MDGAEAQQRGEGGEDDEDEEPSSGEGKIIRYRKTKPSKLENDEKGLEDEGEEEDGANDEENDEEEKEEDEEEVEEDRKAIQSKSTHEKHVEKIHKSWRKRTSILVTELREER